MLKRVLPHLPQILRYLCSGGAAAALEICSNYGMLFAGVPYLASTVVSGLIGTVSAFLFHKYFVFQKRERTPEQLFRYIIQQAVNLAVQVGLVYLLVTFVGVQPGIAKILSIGLTVSWNFLIYKFFVYV